MPQEFCLSVLKTSLYVNSVFSGIYNECDRDEKFQEILWDYSMETLHLAEDRGKEEILLQRHMREVEIKEIYELSRDLYSSFAIDSERVSFGENPKEYEFLKHENKQYYPPVGILRSVVVTVLGAFDPLEHQLEEYEDSEPHEVPELMIVIRTRGDGYVQDVAFLPGDQKQKIQKAWQEI